MRNHVQPGRIITAIAPQPVVLGGVTLSDGGVKSGVPAFYAGFAGVPVTDAAPGEKYELQIEEVFAFPLANGIDWVQPGMLAYVRSGGTSAVKTPGVFAPSAWPAEDEYEQNKTATFTSIGTIIEVVDGTVLVRLTPGFAFVETVTGTGA